MKATLEMRALAACRDLVATRAEVERLGHVIGMALGDCLNVWIKAQPCEYPDISKHEHHLKAAYEPVIIESSSPYYEDYGVHYNDNAAIVAMLAVCPHCLAAHNAIQERKAARRKLGAARRAVTMIGRTK